MWIISTIVESEALEVYTIPGSIIYFGIGVVHIFQFYDLISYAYELGACDPEVFAECNYPNPIKIDSDAIDSTGSNIP